MIIYIIIMDETTYSQILHFYSSADRKYPEYIYDVPLDKRVDAKSKFRQLAKPYHFEGGIVKHGDKEVLVKGRIDGVLKAFHDNPVTGGHFGRDKTLSKLSERFYWKGIILYPSSK